ncbi:hypothetical protein [Asticcacaulis solisilvae]|uniref:hypothetical protein n=1 Tax=Asticcacaulis solisilvae TaxID=1217274 RepID=UPI003FD738D8
MIAIVLMAALTAAAQVSSLDLSGPFHTRSPWTLTASQGPEVADPAGLDEKVPGTVTLCLSRDRGRHCDPDVTGRFRDTTADDIYAQAHFAASAIQHLPGATARPVLQVRTATTYSIDGNQGIRFQFLLYDAARDAFVTAYDHVTGHNNNEDIRFVASGPLQGDIIVAEPTQDKPYAFWVVVNRLSGAGVYAPVLRYRSATAYGDGNPLAVIDSEMPNIQKRLGMWKPGQSLPLPEKTCLRPHLVRTELWCQ